ncbi:C40 family peptidase [Nocardioides pakistanensis]
MSIHHRPIYPARSVPLALATTLIAAMLSALAPAVTAPASALTVHKATRVLTVAADLKGTPYRYGGTTRRGFDCSGYTQFVYRRVGERLPRVSDAQYRATRRIPRSQARRGDLVFFHFGSKRGHVYHVGIYAGRGKMWHAPYTGTRVHKTRIWTYRGVTFGRVR